MSADPNNNNNVPKSQDFNDTFGGMEDLASPYVSPAPSDDEGVDSSLQEAVKAHDKGKTKLAALPRAKEDVEYEKERCCFSIGNCGREWNIRNVHKHVALMSGLTPERVVKGGTGLFHIEFAKEDHAVRACTVKYTCGKVVSMSGAMLYYYRLNFRADEIKADHEDRIIAAVKEECHVDVVSVKINEEKKCVSVYLPHRKCFARFLRAPFANSILVKGVGAFNPTYFLLASRSCASTSDPDIVKMQISHIPAYYDEESLYDDVCEVLSPIIPRSRVLGLSIYQYPDSNRNAPFGFVHILGVDSAELLERIEISVPGSKTALLFQRAVEKRKREE